MEAEERSSKAECARKGAVETWITDQPDEHEAEPVHGGEGQPEDNSHD